jgi:sigma-B regulation protein RsbU (phosphoserine phosphatase)
LEPGDTVLMYTDGVNEAMSPRRQLYGVERVHATVRAGPASLAELCEHLLADVRDFTCNLPQNDDICMIGIQRQ